MSGSRFLNPQTPGGLLSTIQGLLTASQTLVVQAIASGTYFVFNEVPTGAINGSNVTFTLANTPNPSTSVEIYLNGIKQKPTSDYSIASATITFVVAPDVGSTLLVNYTVSPV